MPNKIKSAITNRNIYLTDIQTEQGAVIMVEHLALVREAIQESGFPAAERNILEAQLIVLENTIRYFNELVVERLERGR